MMWVNNPLYERRAGIFSHVISTLRCISTLKHDFVASPAYIKQYRDNILIISKVNKHMYEHTNIHTRVPIHM